MSDEWNKGSSSTGPQRSDEVQQGPFARQQALRQEREAAARAARERDQRLQDQMIRDAIWTASQPAGTDTSRIFGPPSSRRRGGGAVLAIAALVLLFVIFGSRNEIQTLANLAMAAQQRLQPSVTSPRGEPAPMPVPTPTPNSPLTTQTASVADRSAAAPPMPPMERFALRRFELVSGDALALVVSWQMPEGTRRAAAMDAFIVSRDAARHRTPLLERWSVFPGESSIPLALPAGIPPGKYELETVWTLGGEAREMRTQFTLLERRGVSGAGSVAVLPLVSAPAPAPAPAPAHDAAATLVTATPPAKEPTSAPATEQANDPVRPLPTTLGSPPGRPRISPAGDQLYTGG